MEAALRYCASDEAPKIVQETEEHYVNCRLQLRILRQPHFMQREQ
jgi:hypothetical protein